MSKGLGPIERSILGTMEDYHRGLYRGDEFSMGSGLTVHLIVVRIRPDVGEGRWRNVAYRHSVDSVRRAVKTLERKGLIKCVMPGDHRDGAEWILWKWRPTAEDREYREKTRGGEAKAGAREYAKAHGWCRRPSPKPGLSQDERVRLSKLAGMLSSNHQGERDAAVLKLEEERKRLGKTWPELLGIDKG